MDFQTFQPMCPYSNLVYTNSGGHARMEFACCRKDRVPPEHSWGSCDKVHCPYFGDRFTGENVKIYDQQGKLIGTAAGTSGIIVFPQEPEKEMPGRFLEQTVCIDVRYRRKKK